MNQSNDGTEFIVKQKEGKTILEYRLKFLTPMFGGGVETDPPKQDLVTTIRGASIKGQLRFWWRAARGAQFTSTKELFKREAQLFGAAALAGEDANSHRGISIYLDTSKLAGRPTPPPVDVAYASFPLREGNGVNNVCEMTGDFSLFVNCPRTFEAGEIDEIKAAIWAFVHFGGIGGRTRRGFGAIAFVAPPKDMASANMFDKWVIPETENMIPHLPSLSGARVEFSPARDKADAWHSLVRSLWKFRQGPKVGRNEGKGNRPAGRSRWPEPDLIRHDLSNNGPIGSKDHQHRLITLGKAPRAAFGMPVVFELIDEHIKVKLTPQSEDPQRDDGRLASPLIIRPMLENGVVKSGILILGNRTSIDSMGKQIVIKRMGQGGPLAYLPDTPVTCTLEPGEEKWNNSPMANFGHDPLIAFLEFFKAEQGN